MSDKEPPPWNPENPQAPYGAPPQQPQYSTPPPPQYTTPPPRQYGAPPPPYGAPPQQPYGQPEQPYHGQPQQPYHHQQPPKNKKSWLIAGGIALVLALVGGVTVFLASHGGDETAAGDSMPTATYSDGVTSTDGPSAIPSPTDPPTYTPEPTPTPVPPPERRRTLKDIDQGIKVYDDVYIKPAPGWRKVHQTKYGVSLLAAGRGAAYAWVSPVAYRAEQAAPQAANTVIAVDHLIAAKKSPVETVSSANSNIETQAQISLTGRIHTTAGASVSMVARCTVMTGVESIHNVTVVLCVEGRQDDPNAAFRDMPRMLASLARSI